MRSPALSAVLLVAVSVSACTGDSPTTPTNPTPTPPPASTTVSLSGTVSAQAGGRIAGATVTFLDGANAGRATTTNGNGEYRFDGVTRGNANLSAVAPTYEESRRGLFVDNNTLTFTLRTLVPWRRDGVGNTVFDRPTYFTRVRIIGTYTAYSSNFILHCGTQHVVNELLGTGWGPTRYEGVHQLNANCNPIETVSSTGVAWSVIEER